MIAIVDYGLGNISAFSNMYKRMNIHAQVAKNANDLVKATKLIIPGVGAFDHAMKLLEDSGMRPTLDDLVVNHKMPVLGICVGMQILASTSDEGRLPGLGWIPGEVKAFRSDPRTKGLALPHMGWNDVHPAASSRLFEELETDARFYFLHSFYFECASAEHSAATTGYGIDFSCAVRAGNVFGVQFHPEKSHHYGAQLLKNFADL